MLKALRHPPVFRLWLGQALSTIGDEIYRVGLTWLAVGLIGPDTGFLTAAQAAALMIFSFGGGKWADHWDPFRTMVRVDAWRAVIVLIPVLYSFFHPVTLPLLVPAALLLSALTAFFDPALQTVLPQVSPDLGTLRAATGLMMTTIRLARMVGPAIVGLCAGWLPPIHFFTLDGISFLLSAWLVSGLQPREGLPPRAPLQRLSFAQAVAAGFHSVRRQPGMGFIVFSKAITGGTWNLSFVLGFALLVQTIAPGDTRAFGLVMAAYGLGNFAGALYFGNLHRPRPAFLMFTGYIWLGSGFLLVALAPSIFWLLPAAVYTGFSGTANEVTFSDLVQSYFPVQEMGRVFRLRVATDTAFTLVLMAAAPVFLRWFSVQTMIALCGAVWIATGLFGFSRFLFVDRGISADAALHPR